MRRARARRAGMAVAVVAAVAGIAGCTVPKPPGAAPLRYRDAIFPSVSVTKDLTYGSAPAADGSPVALKLDLYQPAGDSQRQRPALIWVHGGGFITGSKSSGAGKATTFAKLGYVAVSIDYRLLAPPGCAGDPDPAPACETAALAAQHDAQAAVRWLRANATTYGVDPSRIAIGGASAGAITALLVGRHAEDPGTSGNPGPSSAVRGVVSVSGGTPTNDFIDRGDPATIMFHGTADRTVFYSWAVQNAAAMLAAGVPVVLEPIEGAGHGLAAQYGALIDEQSDWFLYDVLDLAHAPGQPAAAARAAEAQARQLRARYGRLVR